MKTHTIVSNADRLWELEILKRAAYKAQRVAENMNDLNAIETARERYWRYLDEIKELNKLEGLGD